jgi:hypothetical protein
MTLTVAEFKELFPQFASISDVAIQFHLDCIADQVSEALFGECYKRAAYLLLAHVVTEVIVRAGASGPVTSERVGNLAKTYGTNANSSSSLSTTSYGVEYLRLVKLYASGGTTVC